MEPRISLLIGEDNADVCTEIRNLLSEEFDLIAVAGNGMDLIAAANKFKPDVIVTDITMPKLNGIEASRRILELGYCRAVVVSSVSNSPELVKAALEAGISGYVLKENVGEELISAIRAAAVGRSFLSSDIVYKKE